MVVGIAALCLAVGVIAVKAGSDIVLAKATGQVEVRSHQAATWKSVSTGTSLHFGDVIRTGAQSKAEIRFESGIIRMYENTILELPSQPPQLKVSDDSGQLKKVFLQRGRSLFEVFKNRLSGGFEVTSPSLIAGVKGTTFRVTEEPGLKGVTVFEGTVLVTNRQHPEEAIEVRSNHYTVLLDGHLTPAREFQSQEEELDDRRVQIRMEERLTDLLEENRDLQTEVLSSSILIDTSRTLDTTLINPDGTLSSTTGTIIGTVTGLIDTSFLGLP